MIFPYNKNKNDRVSRNNKVEYENLKRSINKDSISWYELFKETEGHRVKKERLEKSFPHWSIESNDLLYLFVYIGIFKFPVIYLLDYFLCQQSIEVLINKYPVPIIHLICLLVPMLILCMDMFIGMRIYLSERLRQERDPWHFYKFWMILGAIFSLTIPALVLSTFYAFGKMETHEFALTLPFILLSMVGHFLMIYDYTHFESMYFYQYKFYRFLSKRLITKNERALTKLQSQISQSYTRFEVLHQELNEIPDISAEFFLITSARRLVNEFIKSGSDEILQRKETMKVI